MIKLTSHNLQNKKSIAKIITIIYNDKSDIPNYLKEMLLKRLLWATTEHDNDGLYRKYEGQPFWTIGAIQQFLKNLAEKETNKKLNPYYNLRHEHSVPKIEIEKLIKASNKSEQEIFEILDNLGYAVVVSKDEDDLLNKKGFRSKMPNILQNNSDVGNVFSRYKEVGIKVCDVREMNLKGLIIDNLSEIEKFSILS